jgi:hypothetical protein
VSVHEFFYLKEVNFFLDSRLLKRGLQWSTGLFHFNQDGPLSFILDSVALLSLSTFDL